jgi:hypothetical protein
MAEYGWVKQILNSIGIDYQESKPVQEYRFNEMYPYTVEQTVKVTHYTKPKRRDASRRWKR